MVINGTIELVVGKGRKNSAKRPFRFVSLFKVIYPVSSIVWYMHKGYLPKEHLVYIDGDKMNSRIENLREVINHS
jgi:hypothetical protein